jgi:hypothetical protein
LEEVPSIIPCRKTHVVVLAQKKHRRSIAAFDVCRLDDPVLAVAEAKKKFAGILKTRK